jgi:hypothetical protein
MEQFMSCNDTTYIWRKSPKCRIQKFKISDINLFVSRLEEWKEGVSIGWRKDLTPADEIEGALEVLGMHSCVELIEKQDIVIRKWQKI